MAPQTFVGSVALTGSPQSIPLDTAPLYESAKVSEIEISTTSTTPLLVQILDGATSVFEAYVVSGAPVSLNLPFPPRIAPGDEASLSLPAGSGNVAYSITLS